jgi:hypothetical protein
MQLIYIKNAHMLSTCNGINGIKSNSLFDISAL